MNQIDFWKLFVLDRNAWNFIIVCNNYQIGIVIWNSTIVYKLFLLDGNGGACGVMVIIVGNGHGDTSSNPGRDWLHFT